MYRARADHRAVRGHVGDEPVGGQVVQQRQRVRPAPRLNNNKKKKKNTNSVSSSNNNNNNNNINININMNMNSSISRIISLLARADARPERVHTQSHLANT